MTPVEGSLFQVCKPAFQIHSLKVVGVVGKALRRVSVNSVVRKSAMFSNVIATSPFLVARLCSVSLVVRFSASLTDVEGVPVGAVDLINCSLSVPWFVLVFDVSQLLT